MPLYDMVCPDCDHRYELEQSIKYDLPYTCPACDGKNLTQDYGRKSLTINDGVPRTIAQQAEQNAKALGTEKMEEMRTESKKLLGRDKPRPWWRDEDKPVDLSKIKDVNKWIATGDKT